MKRRLQFSLGALLFAVLVFAILFAEVTQPVRWLSLFITFAILQVVALGTCVEVLARNIPTALAKSQQDNCVRPDGTWSKKREKIEQRSVSKLRRELSKAFMLVALTTNVVILFVHCEVIPIPIAIEAMSAFDVVESQWKSNLRNDESRFDSWIGHSLSNEEVAARKRLLWNGWPVVVGAIGLWAVGAFAFVAQAYSHSLKELSASIRFRAEQYRLRGLHESVGHDDFAKLDRSRKHRKRSNLHRAV